MAPTPPPSTSPHRVARVLAALSLTALSVACAETPPPSAGTTTASPTTVSTEAQGGVHAPAASAGANGVGPSAAPPSAGAIVGAPAPDFTLRDLEGKEVRLSSFVGKRVVLEWFNPGCPFVDKAHTVGSLKTLAREWTGKGVVWLAINSGAAGKQGHGVAANREGATRYGLAHPILLDEDGAVGKRYGATRTPHMFVVDERGTVVYRGAIDNSPDAEGQSPEGGRLENHVANALTALEAGKPVPVAETKPYGCSVKY